MKKPILIFICFCLLIIICFGQDTDKVYVNQLFSKGIYLENLNVYIPWKINYSEISKYGNPKINKDPNHRNEILIEWDSVKILNGINISLYNTKPKRVLNSNISQLTGMIRGLTDSLGFQKLKSFFQNYTHHEGKINQKNFPFFHWNINDYEVFVGYNKAYEYFLWVDKIH